jgi:hypothetical protein
MGTDTVTLNSTEHYCTVNGMGCRVWKGASCDAQPMPLLAFIPLIMVLDEAHRERFERALTEPTPGPADDGTYPKRLDL